MRVPTFNELFVVFTVLNTLDVYLTLKIIERGGRELNPIIATLIKWFGPLGGLAFMKALTLATVWTHVPHTDYEVFFAGFCIYYAAVCIHNWTQLEGK